MLYILFGVLILTAIFVMVIKGLRAKNSAQDSLLKQRAIFSTHQQLIFMRLKELLPDFFVFVHVSYDSLLTTKFAHTRAKYKEMVADFVIVDENYQILAIINLESLAAIKRGRQMMYEEEILKSAGYRVLHYKGLPEADDLSLGLAHFLKKETRTIYKKLEFLTYFPKVNIIL